MIRLYRAPFSTNCERVLLALAEKGLEHEPVWVDYADRSPVIEVSGQELVPVLEEDGTVVADSLTILRHLELGHPDPPLFPAEPAPRSEVDLFLDWFDQVWKVAPNAIEADPSGTPRHAIQMAAHLDLFESLLDGRDFLLGGFSAADCAAYPFLKYAVGREAADDETFHVILDEHQSVQGRPRLAAWIDRVSNR